MSLMRRSDRLPAIGPAGMRVGPDGFAATDAYRAFSRGQLPPITYSVCRAMGSAALFGRPPRRVPASAEHESPAARHDFQGREHGQPCHHGVNVLLTKPPACPWRVFRISCG